MSQSCITTILSKLPNLTALNFDRIGFPVNEEEVSLPTVLMQCIHMCAVTQPAQHACIHSLVCQMSQEVLCNQEGRGVQYLQPGSMAVYQILTCTVHQIVDWFYIEVHVATLKFLCDLQWTRRRCFL